MGEPEEIHEYLSDKLCITRLLTR